MTYYFTVNFIYVIVFNVLDKLEQNSSFIILLLIIFYIIKFFLSILSDFITHGGLNEVGLNLLGLFLQSTGRS